MRIAAMEAKLLASLCVLAIAEDSVGGYGGYFNGSYSGSATYSGTGGYSGGYANSTGSYSITGGYSGGYGNSTGGYSGGYGNSTGSYSSTGGYSGGSGNWSGSYSATGGYSGGYGSSTGSYSSTGGYSGGSGNWSGGYSSTGGSYTGGYGGMWTYCEEMYCYGTEYLDNGEVDWDATYAANVTCSTYDKGCPCNDKWELECESYGMKMCTPKMYGCYDPFNVTCTDQEQLCKDEWSAYCWDKSWGSCPLYCGAEETYCYSYVYDATGEVNWTAPMTEFCGNVTTGCPCDATWEHKCTDAAYGYSWCNPKSSPCPITCGMDEQVCYSTAYDSTGNPDWMAAGNQTCASWNSSCPCDPEWEEMCVTEWGSYCQTKIYGSCPISCRSDQPLGYEQNIEPSIFTGRWPTRIYCYETPYDEYGNMNWDGVWQETCANITDGCPCNEQWEQSCGTGWCIPKWDSCPIDCGDNIMCYHYSGNQSCATSAGCTCEADEYSCQDSIGKYECYAKEWYPDGCPVVCTVDQLYCSTVGFDVSGYMKWSTFCKDRT
ncbi:unnamed protein product, partial [Effrenium voratum]